MWNPDWRQDQIDRLGPNCSRVPTDELAHNKAVASDSCKKPRDDSKRAIWHTVIKGPRELGKNRGIRSQSDGNRSSGCKATGRVDRERTGLRGGRDTGGDRGRNRRQRKEKRRKRSGEGIGKERGIEDRKRKRKRKREKWELPMSLARDRNPPPSQIY